MLSLRIFFFLAISSIAVGQVTQTVVVGTFYNPPLLAAAAQDDVIVFQFTAGTHGVTQSSMDRPCIQLAGGFNSGLIPGNTVDPPTWNLTISNISTPIWFFCQNTVPFSHCANGMVGAVNAPLDQYASFTSAAKTVSGTPTPVTSVALTGQGAFASAPPSSPTITSVPASPTSNSTSAPVVSTATTHATSSSKSSSTGAAIGGGVGGGLAVVIIGILGFLLFRARRKQPMSSDPYVVPLEPGTGMHYDRARSPGNASYVASQRTGGSEGAPSGNLMYQPGGGMASISMNSPYEQFNSGRPMGMGIVGGQGAQNSTSNFDGPAPNQITNTGGYAVSEPASDANEREQSDFIITPFPPNSPMSSLEGAAYRDNNEPRTSTYTESRSSGYKSPRRTDSDVKEIAKEVAGLLLPQLRANDPSQTTLVTTSRQLPLPTDPLGDILPPDQPRSPAPPQYEQYN